MNHAFTNELINESSPYLLKHAHNPVQWHAWNKAALARAKELDRPILASIGYSACHWCHVMEKESFENEKTASYMNEHFINIKIDREERPDLDHIYMDAVQAISGSGGWPLNVFLTPEGKPFYGGTYFPPEKAFNRASWKDILFFISDAWKQKRDEIEKQAEILLEHINSSTRFISKGESFALLEGENFFTREKCDVIAEELLKSADSLFGGFGNAPKFPQTFSIQYLLHYGYHFNHDKSLEHARFSLNQLMHGGIYDHLAGGMARYSTDAQWMVPHFEKMLYDNALLVSVLCDAFQITSDVFYKKAIKKTLDFFVKEMKHPDGGFYAALDADSEGIEGKFYVWKKAEIDNILGAESAIFCEWYAVSEAGNWEHTNILHTPQSMQDFGIKHLTTASELEALLVQAEAKLLTERNKRIRPITDDKILLGWNALLLTAFCKASAALDDIEYKNLAVSLYDFIRKTFTKDGENFFHTYKNNLARYNAYLDDYSYFIQSCIWLQEITGKNEYLEQAKKLTFYLVDNFFDDVSGFFYYTDKHQQDIITRKIELYDNAIPSGNSVMAENLFYLSVVFDKRDWWKMAKHMVNAISGVILQHPLSFGIWANIILKQTAGIDEIVITGVNSENVLKEVLEIYLPGRVLQISTIEKDYPLLRNKSFEQTPCIYWCRNYTCGPPMTSVTELKKQLKIIS